MAGWACPIWYGQDAEMVGVYSVIAVVVSSARIRLDVLSNKIHPVHGVGRATREYVRRGQSNRQVVRCATACDRF